MELSMERNYTDFKSKSRSDKIKTKISLGVEALLSIPKTVFFNFRCFPFFLAIKMPVLISYKVKLVELHKNIICFSCTPYRFMVKIGFGGSYGVIERKSLICLEEGRITFNGKASFSDGIVIRNNGEMFFGDNFWANKNCTFWCSKRIAFGDNVLLGWNIVLRDSDGHLLVEKNTAHEVEGTIDIGNHCWICSECHILKNSGIGNDCVLGYGSLLTKQYKENNALLVGRPANLKKNNINWIRGE